MGFGTRYTLLQGHNILYDVASRIYSSDEYFRLMDVYRRSLVPPLNAKVIMYVL